jgi:hemerythrin-like domain-containing protein
MNEAVRVIQQRNDTMTLILAAALIQGRRGRAGIAPDFGWLSGMLSYVDNTARALHFRDEESAILKPLERAAPEMRPKIARARRNHVGSSGYCYRMIEAVGYWQKSWDRAAEMYLENARDHFQLARTHARLMRTVILPAAEKALPQSHWAAVTPEILRTADPLAGCRSRADYEKALCALLGRREPPAPYGVAGGAAAATVAVASGN